MARKEKRLDEIQELLREEITPKLDRLREEKRAFLEFQKKSSELERLSKVVIAYDWTQLKMRKVKATEDVEGAQARLKESVAGRGRMEGEIKRMEKEIGDIQKRRDKVSVIEGVCRSRSLDGSLAGLPQCQELAKGGKVQILEQQQSTLEKEVSKLEAQVEIMNGNLKEEQTKIAELEHNASEVRPERLLSS
jgi:structural maintenance of chromosome 2